MNNYEFLHQTGSSFDFNYDAITSYAKCSFFEEDENIMIDLLLDLALQEKNMFEVKVPWKCRITFKRRQI